MGQKLAGDESPLVVVRCSTWSSHTIDYNLFIRDKKAEYIEYTRLLTLITFVQLIISSLTDQF
jgi:hypothetical protein